MKRNDIKQLSAKSVSELQQEVVKLQELLVELRMSKAINKEKNVRLYKLKRQDLARIKTILREKKLLESVSGSK